MTTGLTGFTGGFFFSGEPNAFLFHSGIMAHLRSNGPKSGPRNYTYMFSYTRQQPKKLSINRRNDFEATPVCVAQSASVCAENRFSVANDCLPVSLIKDLYI